MVDRLVLHHRVRELTEAERPAEEVDGSARLYRFKCPEEVPPAFVECGRQLRARQQTPVVLMLLEKSARPVTMASR